MNENTIVPLYQQVKEDIKAAIQNGKYKTKEKIPAEPALSAEYSVSRITIRRAVEELCSEGYLVKMQGRGTFVSTPRIHRKFTATGKVESFSTTCKEQGMTAGAKVLDCKIVPARQDEIKFLKLDGESLLVYIERVRTADGQPIFLENMFLPYEEYKDIMKMDLTDTSIFSTIQKISGRSPSNTLKKTLEITKASVEQAQILGIPLGEPLFFLNSYFLDEEGTPLCIGRQYYIGSRYMFEL